jgi:pimeloyl-ACP methyl ester carboxylesterase
VKPLVMAALTTIAPGTSLAAQASVNGLRMYYEVHGQGRPLVLLHGGGSTIQTSFGAILPRLARTHRVIAPEQQGHGHTADLDRPLSFEQMADDTATFLEQLGVEQADVLGFSNGGMVALQLALRHPGLVRRLVLCSSFFAHDGLDPGMRRGLEHATPADMPAPLREAYLAASPRPDLASFVRKIVAMMTSFADVPEERLRTVRAPTLVMMGDRDVVSVEHAARLARLVPAGELAVFPGSAHGTYLGVAEAAVPGSPLPDLAISMIEAFLGR